MVNKKHLIDIHTHIKNNSPGAVLVISEIDDIPPVEQYFCVGVHPWNIEKIREYDSVFNSLKELSQRKNFFALGEIGLDKSIETDFETQKDLFDKTLLFVKENNIKNIVIHNVQAFNEVFEKLKEHKIKSKILWHDFSGNLQMAKQALDHFDSYFSFGPRMKNTKTAECVKALPLEKVFFETDDQVALNIEDIYSLASEILSFSSDELDEKIKSNFEQFAP